MAGIKGAGQPEDINVPGAKQSQQMMADQMMMQTKPLPPAQSRMPAAEQSARPSLEEIFAEDQSAQSARPSLEEIFAEPAAPAPEENTEIPGEGFIRGALQAAPIAGSMFGGALGLGAAGVGAIPGAAGGAALGTAVKNLGEHLLGDKKTRSDIYLEPIKEAGLAAAGEQVASKITSYLAGRAATKAAGSVIPGEKIIAQEVDEVVDASNRLREAGLIQNIPGTDTVILPHQADLSNPDLQQMAKNFSSNDKFRGALIEQGKLIKDTYKNISQKIAGMTGKSTGTGDEFLETALDLDKAEGKLIGEFREKASKLSGSKQIQTPNLYKNVQELSDSLGFKREGPRLIAPTATELASNLGIAEKEAELVLNQLKPLQERMFNSGGKVPFNELNNRYKGLTRVINNMKYDVPYDVKNAVLKLKDGIRDDMNRGVGVLLGPSEQKAYTDALGRFSEIKQATKTLNTTLKKDAISTSALVNGLFSKGKNALQEVRAVKTLLKEDPELWGNIKANFLHTIAEPDPATGKVAWNSVAKKLNGLGDDVLGELFESNGKVTKQNLNDFIKVASKVDSADVKMLTEGKNGIMRDFFLATQSTFAGSKMDAVVGLVGNMGKDSALKKYISANGVESLAKGLGKKEASFARKLGAAIRDQVVSRSPQVINNSFTSKEE